MGRKGEEKAEVLNSFFASVLEHVIELETKLFSGYPALEERDREWIKLPNSEVK